MTIVDIETTQESEVPTQEGIVAPIPGTWLWNNQTTSPPGSKQIRSNTGDWLTATQLMVTNIDNDGFDRSAVIALLKVGDQLRLEHKTDNLRFVIYIVSSAILAGSGFFTIPVARSSSGGAIPNTGTQITAALASTILPGTALNHIICDLTLVTGVSKQMVQDFMEDVGENLQVVTHMVNNADFSANVGGVTITYSKAILPAMQGPPQPLPI